MNSIDNLREYVLTAASVNATTRAVLAGYVDSIDKEVDDMWHALTIDAKPMTDENMAESGWVRLPVDAEGVPIHVGDVMDERLPFGGYAAPAPVDTMELSRGAGGYGWMVRLDSESGAFINPKLLRHHHAPTVEDVLREFGKRWDDPAHYAKGELVEEYAAKLQLKEG